MLLCSIFRPFGLFSKPFFQPPRCFFAIGARLRVLCATTQHWMLAA